MSDLTTALMDALGCQRWHSRPECETHGDAKNEPSGWPCPVAERVEAALLADPAAMLDALVSAGVLVERVTRTHHVASAFDADGQPVSFAMTGRDAYALRELMGRETGPGLPPGSGPFVTVGAS